MKRSNLTLFLYGALIFLGGAGVGVLGYRFYAASSVSATTNPPPPDAWRKRFTEDMRTRVKLDHDQMSKLGTTLDESRTLFDQVRQKYRPEMKAIYDSQVSKIKGMLTPEQLPEYERILEEQRIAREKAGR